MVVGRGGASPGRREPNVARYSSQEWLEPYFDNIPVPLLVLDLHGRICGTSRAARETFGELSDGQHDQALGQALHCLRAADQPHGCGMSAACGECAVHELLRRTVFSGCMHRQVEAKIARRRGNETTDCHVLMSTVAVELLEGPRILVCLEDITARKLAELALHDALQEVERLKDQLQRENLCLREEIRQSHSFEEIVGQSLPLHRVLERIDLVARTNTSVLILGETGTGKELIARAIHSRSARREQPLVTMNCAAVPASLLESELFGYVAGAFTGAVADKPGRFELAHEGTIFLDEVAELPLELQAKLLRVLERGELWVLGSTMRTVDVRVIAATNRDLRQAVATGGFRADLYYRLAVFPVDVPPLRARRSDIPLLAAHFLAKKQAELGRWFDGISAEMLQALVDYDWPGNVRELQNVIERAMILSPGRSLQLDVPLLPSTLRHPTFAAGDDLASADRSHITRILEECGWRIKGEGNAAERLQMKPSTLRSRMKKLGIVRR